MENNEIKPDASADLLSVLSDTKIVLLLDDSGSMSTRVVDPGASAFALSAGGVQATRWSELEKLTASVVDMLTAAPTAEKMDAYFLNRGKHLNVSDRSQIAPFFSQGPRGGTPLCGSLRRIFDAYQADMQAGRRVLVIVITDGEPSDGGVDDLFSLMESALKYGRNKDKLFVSFAECNDNEEEMAYLDGWDTRLPHFDNTDDFPMEALRVKAAQRARGERQRFTYVDYVIKIVLGAVLRKYWNMDQIGAKGPVFSSVGNASGVVSGGVISNWYIPPSVVTVRGAEPATKEGNVTKQGSFWPSWKLRRFVLARGCITYFAGNTKKGAVLGVRTYKVVDATRLRLRGDREMLVRFSSPYELNEWKQALEEHIQWNLSSS